MDGLTIVKVGQQIIDSIKSQYNCEIRDDSSIPGYKYDDNIIIQILFETKIDLLDIDSEASKFTITLPRSMDTHSPYKILKYHDERVPVFYIWAKYHDDERHGWRKYTLGDKIIGEPEVRKEYISKPSTGKAGSVVEIKLLRCDLVDRPLNLLHLERFLAKYCPLKVKQ